MIAPAKASRPNCFDIASSRVSDPLGTAVFRRSMQAERRLLLTIEKIPCRAVNKFIQRID
jgi:hypothetical protein